MRNTNAHTLKADAFATADCKFELGNLGRHRRRASPTFGNTVGRRPGVGVRRERRADPHARRHDPVPRSATRSTRPASTARASTTAPPASTASSAATTTTPSGAARATTSSRAATEPTSRSAARATTSSPTSPATTCPRAVPATTPSTPGPVSTSSWAARARTSPTVGPTPTRPSVATATTSSSLGQSLDAAFGDSGDDWEEGGDQPDLMQGDSGNLFFLDDSQAPGHDILIGQGGDDDYDMEGGDDIGLGGPGIEKVAGASGLRLGDRPRRPAAQDMDLALPLVAAGHPRRSASATSSTRSRPSPAGTSTTPSAVTTWFRPRSAAAASSAVTSSTRTASTGSPVWTPWCRSRDAAGRRGGQLGGRTARS